MEKARQELAQYARDLTDGGRTVIRLYSEVMDGLREDEGFKPHHRIATDRELLKRGFDYECDHAQVSDDSQPVSAVGPAAPEARPEPASDDSEPKEYEDDLAIVKRAVESMGPIEAEDNDDSGHNPDYSMWDAIPQPRLEDISDEYAETGAALFHKALERWRAWDESDVKIPPKKDYRTYDDG